MCHDYKAPGRNHYAWETTVGEQRADNARVKDGVDEEAFVAMREARDATLAAPVLLLPSIQVNIRAGKLPAPVVRVPVLADDVHDLDGLAAVGRHLFA